jgi:hypothetical protein
LNKINDNISLRGIELPIETRMKSSIAEAFKKSDISAEKVHANKREVWGEAIYKRAKRVNWEEIYFAVFSLPSHAIHGNWQDLITYHLEYDNGEFTPKTEWSLDEIAPAYSEKNQMNSRLDDIVIRIQKADELHEKFLQRKHI